MRRIYLILSVLIGLSMSLQAQNNYPVTASPILFGTGQEWSKFYTSTEFFKISLLLKDNSKSNIPIFLRFKLERVGLVIKSREDYIPLNPVSRLDFGRPEILTGVELADMFHPDHLVVEGEGLSKDILRQGGRLPDGFYTLTVTAYEHDASRGYRQVSNVGFSLMTIFKGYPPQISYPKEGEHLPEMGVQNILFQWLPRGSASLGGLSGLSYTFELFELKEGDNPNMVANGSRPIFTTVTNLTSLPYGQGYGHTLLEAGKRYAVRVRVESLSGNEYYNKGYSEVVSFYYGEPCLAPEHLRITSSTIRSYNLAWDAQSNAESYELAYMPNDSKMWAVEPSYFINAKISRREGSAYYQFKVRSVCFRGRTSDWSPVITDLPMGIKTAKLGLLPPPPPPNLTTPDIDKVLNPYDIPVSSEPITPINISDKYNDIKTLKNTVPTPCGAAIISEVGCDPVSNEYDGTEDFIPSASSLIYINGYEILVSKGNAASGRGLLYVPAMSGRIPVEWSGLTIKKGPEGTYGCITNGEVKAQGSDGTVLSDDLKQQIIDLLTQGPNSFSGKFGEALQKAKELATTIKNTPVPSPNAPQSEKDAYNNLLKDLKSVSQAVQKGINEWKESITGIYGTSFSTAIEQEVNKINQIQTLFQNTETCLTAQITPTGSSPSRGNGGNDFVNYQLLLSTCTVDYVALIDSPTKSTEITDKFKEEEEKRKVDSSKCLNYTLSAVPNNPNAVKFGIIDIVFPEPIQVINTKELKVISSGKTYIAIFDITTCNFSGFYDKAFQRPVSQISGTECGECLGSLSVSDNGNISYTTDLCKNGYYDKKLKTFGNRVNDFLGTPLSATDFSFLEKLYGGNLKSYEESDVVVQLKLFLTDANTDAADKTAIEAYMNTCSDCIWLDKKSDGWHLQELGYAKTTLTEIKQKALEIGKSLLALNKNSPVDKICSVLYTALSKAEKWISEVKVPDKYWNCDDPNYFLYKWILDDATLKLPASALASVSLGYTDPRYQLAFAVGICDGVPAFLSGIPAAGKIVAGLGSNEAWSNFNDLYTKLADYDNGSGRTGMWGALKDGLAKEFPADKPCVLAHNIGVLATGVAITALTVGYGAPAATATWVERGMYVLKRLDDLSDVFFVGGKLLKGIKVASSKTIRMVIGDAGKQLFRDINGAIDWSTWSKKLTQNIPNEGDFDVLLPNGESLPAGAKLESLVKDPNGNWVRDAEGYGLGCISGVSFGTLWQKPNHSHEPIFYASLSSKPSFELKPNVFATPPAQGCPTGLTPVVVKAIEATSDILRRIVALEAKIDNLLGDAMKTRYKELFQDIRDAKIPNAESRLDVLEQVVETREQLTKYLNDAGNTGKAKELMGKNIAYSNVSFTNPTTGVTENLSFMSISGQGLDNVQPTTFEGFTLVKVPTVDFNNQWIKPLSNGRARDSEAKIFEQIYNEIKNRGLDLKTVTNVPNSLNLKVEIISEMQPCKSCNGIISKFDGINSTPTNLSFGTNYVDLTNY